MMWLENKTDPVERWLGDALETAQKRTGDEVARRRVWARIEDLPLNPETPPRRWRVILPVMTGSLVAAGVVALLWLVPRSDQVAQQAPVPDSVSPSPASKGAPPESIPTKAKPIRTGSRKARVALPGGAAVDLDANSVLGWDAQRRPQVESGQARFEVAHQAPGNRFAVAAGPYVISVVGTKFRVGVAEGRVSVEVEEGVVEVSRGNRMVRLTEGDSWAGPVRGPARPSAAEHRSAVGRAGARRTSRMASVPPEPVTPAPSFAPSPMADDPVMALPLANTPVSTAAPTVATSAVPGSAELKEARAALSEGRSEEALEILSRCSKGTGPAAENAAYELGRVLRDRLHRPKAAIVAWNQYRTRFPHGLLRAETDLSIMETLASLGDNKTALAEAESFLARYPRSERREEVSKLAARVRATTGP